jgi:flagellar M-ring protein FliF
MVDETAVGPEQIADLQSLVGAAAGIDAARGDTLVVSRIGFDETVQKTLTKQLDARAAVEAQGNDMLLMAGAGGAVLLAAVIGFFLMRGRRKDRRELDALALEAAELYEALGTGATSAVAVPDPAVDLTAERPVSAISGDPVERRRDERRQVVSELIDNQPDEVAELLRGWLGDRRSVRR